MTVTGELSFLETTVQKTHDWLTALNSKLHWENYYKSYQALCAVLQTLRERLPMREALDLVAQMPLLIRGAFFEGWSPSHKPAKMDEQEFLQAVSTRYGPDPAGDPRRLVTAVFELLNEKISAGEMADVRSNLPQDLQQYWAK